MKDQSTDHNLNTADSDYLIDISALWLKIKQSWRFLVGVALLSSLCGLMLTFFLPKKWEAATTIQIGHYPSGGNKKLIEEPSQTVERIRLREFKEKVLNSMGLPIEEDVEDRSDIVLDTLKGVVVKGTDFINLSVRGYSTEEAISSLNEAVTQLQAIHQVIKKPTKDLMEKELQDVTTNLTGVSAELDALKTQMSAAGTYKAGSSFAPSIVAISLLNSKENEVRGLKAQKLQMEAQLLVFEEQDTRIINKIQVSKRPVFPKRSVFMGLGLFFGLVFGVIWLVMKDSLKPQN